MLWHVSGCGNPEILRGTRGNRVYMTSVPELLHTSVDISSIPTQLLARVLLCLTRSVFRDEKYYLSTACWSGKKADHPRRGSFVRFLIPLKNCWKPEPPPSPLRGILLQVQLLLTAFALPRLTLDPGPTLTLRRGVITLLNVTSYPGLETGGNVQVSETHFIFGGKAGKPKALRPAVCKGQQPSSQL